MADKEEAKKNTPLKDFQQKLRTAKDVKDVIAEGLKNTNAKVRSLAIKVAKRTQDHAFIKKHILPLIASDKSKKVLRTLADKTYRKELAQRVKKMVKAKVAGVKAAAEPEAKAAPAAAAAQKEA